MKSSKNYGESLYKIRAKDNSSLFTHDTANGQDQKSQDMISPLPGNMKHRIDTGLFNFFNMSNKDRAELIIEFLYLIIIGVLLYLWSGCAPQKKLHRLLKKHPELVQKDTVRIQDTIEINIPGVKVDTALTLDEVQRDTLIIKEEHLTIRTFYNNDTLYIEGECDTIHEIQIREIEVPTEKVIYRRPRDGLNWYHWMTISLFIVLLIVLSYKLIKKRKARD